MGVLYSPKTVTDGLVLYLDAANGKSFRGEPTTNFFGNSFRNFTGTDYSPDGEWTGTTVTKTFFPDLVTPVGPGATLMTESTSSGRQGLTRYGGGDESGAHSLSAFIFPLTSNITEFTVGLLGDSGNMVYFNLDTGTITYGSGITNRNAILETVPLYPGWFRVGANFEGRSGGWVGSIGFSMQSSYAGSGVLKSTYITGIQYEFKPYITPFVDGTRGTTVATGGGWADRSGNSNHGELINGPTFNSGNLGGIEFDGVDDSIVLTNPEVSSSDGFSIEVVLKPGNITSSSMVITPLSGGIDHYIRLSNNGTLSLRMIPAADSSAQDFSTTTPLSTTKYQHVVFTFKQSDGGQAFYNGTLESSAPSNFTALDWTGTWRVGQRGNNTFFYQGNISILKVYNRVLTPEEVQQNHTAIKGRYNL